MQLDLKELKICFFNKNEWWAQGGSNSRPSRCKRDVYYSNPKK